MINQWLAMILLSKNKDIPLLILFVGTQRA